jgi:hypothetical protein
MRDLLRSMILPVMAATLGLALLVLSVSAADTEPEAISQQFPDERDPCSAVICPH